jgi:hypothetical protein
MLLIWSGEKILSIKRFKSSLPSYQYLVLPSLGLLGLELTILAMFQFLNAVGMACIIMLNTVLSRSTLLRYLKLLRNSRFEFRKFIRQPWLWIFFGIACVHATLLLIPDRNVDVAVFHFPLLNSLVENNGFVFPQIGHPFYGSIPLGSHILAAGLSVSGPNQLALHLINYIVFWSFALMMSKFLGASPILNVSIFLVLTFGFSNYFLFPSTDGMQDVLRSTVTLGALLLVYKFFVSGEMSFLLLSGILTGFAVSLKMSELLVFFWVLILGLLYKSIANLWKLRISILYLFLIPAFTLGGYFYLRNLLFTGNPVYPFLFSHPGITNEWMENYRQVLSNPDDVSLNHYRRDAFSPMTYVDFFRAYLQFFLNSKFLLIMHVVVLIGLIRRNDLFRLFLLNFSMFLFWYLFMFNNNRWALSAHLLTIVIASMIIQGELIRAARYLNELSIPRFKILTSYMLLFSFILQITPYSKVDVLKKLDPLKTYLYEIANQKEINTLAEIGNDARLYWQVHDRRIKEIFYMNQMSPNEFYFLYTGNQQRYFKSYSTIIKSEVDEFVFMGTANEIDDLGLEVGLDKWSSKVLASNQITKTELRVFTKV